MTTDNDNKKETPPPPTEARKPQEVEEGEECSICLDLLPNFFSKCTRATCCGKGMHNKCREDMIASKMRHVIVKNNHLSVVSVFWIILYTCTYSVYLHKYRIH